MAGSNTLIGTLAHLQQHVSTAYSRRLLLNYARKSTGARLGLLLRVDEPGQKFILLEQCGQSPHATRAGQTHIALSGLFGMALHQPGLLEVSDSYSDPRSLPGERGWTWRGGRVLICAVGSDTSDITDTTDTTDTTGTTGTTGTADTSDTTDTNKSGARGVMVLCTGPKASASPISAQTQSEILICAALLSGYLDDTPDESIDEVPALHSQTSRSYDEELPDNALIDTIMEQLALLVDTTLDEQALYRKLLEHAGHVLHTVGASLWLYRPTQGSFALSANAGMEASSLALLADTLAKLAGEQNPPERSRERRLRVVTWSRERVLMLSLLRCNRQLVGAMAFTGPGSDELPATKHALFAAICDVAAVILRNYQLRIEEKQEAIDRERNRIARDIHDGAAQGIVHALHKLEFTQRVLEKQPQVAQRELQRARETLRESLNDLLHDIAALRPIRLEQANFDEAVRDLLDDFSKHEPSIALHYEAAQIKYMPPSLEVPIYRLLQEALHNVRKHAHASHVSVQIQSLPGLLVAQVSDDGAGFRVAPASAATSETLAHLGLRAMQERVEQAGGVLDIASKQGAGVAIKARFPFVPPPVPLTNREREVLRLLADGSTNRIIAGKLSVSVETVKSHVHHIMQKLQVKDRTQAAVLASRQQWV